MRDEDYRFLSHITKNLFFDYQHCKLGQALSIDMHKHQFHEVYIFLAGDASYTIEGRTYKLRPNDILLIANGDIHCAVAAHSSSCYECIFLWVSDGFFRGLNSIGTNLLLCFRHAQQRGCQSFHPPKADMDKILEVCKEIEIERSENKFGSNIIFYSAVMELLVFLNRSYFESSGALYGEVYENDLVNQIITYINKHLTENLTLEQIAAHFYISKHYLSHQFKQFTGFSTYQYIVKKRLKIAYDLLLDGANAADACYQCGFNDYSNFLKAFRREFGKNPSNIKK